MIIRSMRCLYIAQDPIICRYECPSARKRSPIEQDVEYLADLLIHHAKDNITNTQILGLIGHIERAEKLPAINTVAKLSRCLNISLDYLIYGTVSSCDKEHCQLYEDLIGFVDSHSSQPTLY